MRWILKAILFLLKGSAIIGVAAAVAAAVVIILHGRSANYAVDLPLDEQ